MDHKLHGSLHPEREFQALGLPISFGNSNSRQARAAAVAVSRRSLGDPAPQCIAVHRPPPPPPPSMLFNQKPLPPPRVDGDHHHSHSVSQLSDQHWRMQRQSIVPPPPAPLHTRPLLNQQHHLQQFSNVRAAPYNSSAHVSGRELHMSGSRHQPQAGKGPLKNPESLFKDSMFVNPWRGCP
jgi:hypothetical protein